MLDLLGQGDWRGFSAAQARSRFSSGEPNLLFADFHARTIRVDRIGGPSPATGRNRLGRPVAVRSSRRHRFAARTAVIHPCKASARPARTPPAEDSGGAPAPAPPRFAPSLAWRPCRSRSRSLAYAPARAGGLSATPPFAPPFARKGALRRDPRPVPQLRFGLRPPVAPLRAAARRAVARRPPAASAQGGAPWRASLPPSLERGSCRAMPRVLRAGSRPTPAR